MTVLSRRALNRATLDRQLLLRRWELPLLEAIERLAGLQAQTTHTWYHGLWSRLADFVPERLAELLVERQVVRITLMRGTIHLVTARDSLSWRPVLAPMIDRAMKGVFGRNLTGLNAERLAAAGRALVEEEPRTFSELGKLLAEEYPDRDPASLAQAVRAWVPLVQVPPRGVWGASGQARHTSVEAWLGRPVATDPAPDGLVLRYLAAFGPATVKDAQNWSGLTRLTEVVERLRPQLVTFRDEHGRELFDLPDAPRPDPDTPAPVRYLYDYDNLLLGHDDRSRVITDDYRRRDPEPPGVAPQAFLVDGFTSGTWTVTRERDQARLTVQPVCRLAAAERTELTEEGARLLAFAAPGATHDIRFT